MRERQPALAIREGRVHLPAANMHYRPLNELVHAAVARGATHVKVSGVNGQRYLADGLRGDLSLEIEGVPGNDLAAFMDGPSVEVFGNAQDGIGNTMNSGSVVVHGSVGDVVGYGMRGGTIVIRDHAGYRVGIHMKEYAGSRPTIVVGGRAGAFLGEYMAGGLIVVLGLGAGDRPLVGDFCGTGMHGGTIALRGHLEAARVSSHVRVSEATSEDRQWLAPCLEAYADRFAVPLAPLLEERFWVLRPASNRPYGNKYAI